MDCTRQLACERSDAPVNLLHVYTSPTLQRTASQAVVEHRHFHGLRLRLRAPLRPSCRTTPAYVPAASSTSRHFENRSPSLPRHTGASPPPVSFTGITGAAYGPCWQPTTQPTAFVRSVRAPPSSPTALPPPPAAPIRLPLHPAELPWLLTTA